MPARAQSPSALSGANPHPAELSFPVGEYICIYMFPEHIIWIQHVLCISNIYIQYIAMLYNNMDHNNHK